MFSISFEGFTYDVFQSENTFCQRVFKLLYTSMVYGSLNEIPDLIVKECKSMFSSGKQNIDLWTLSDFISNLCRQIKKPAILMIDEVDQASNQQIFLAFLGTLRDQYINRNERPAFQSVILTGVYDIKNLKLRIRPEQEHQYNSPWNIAAKFDIDMSFSVKDIEGMLLEYADAKAFNIGIMFGFLKDTDGQVAVANKIFESHLYNCSGFFDVGPARFDQNVFCNNCSKDS